MSALTDRIYLLEYKQKMKDVEQEKRQKQIELIEKQKEKEQEKKQYEKDLKIALENDLFDKFSSVFDLYKPQDADELKAIYLYVHQIDTRNKIIRELADNENDYKYLDLIYEKTFKKVNNKYRPQVELNFINKQNQSIREKQQKQEKNNDKIVWIAIAVIFALCIPLVIMISYSHFIMAIIYVIMACIIISIVGKIAISFKNEK